MYINTKLTIREEPGEAYKAKEAWPLPITSTGVLDYSVAEHDDACLLVTLEDGLYPKRYALCR